MIYDVGCMILDTLKRFKNDVYFNTSQEYFVCNFEAKAHRKGSTWVLLAQLLEVSNTIVLINRRYLGICVGWFGHIWSCFLMADRKSERNVSRLGDVRQKTLNLVLSQGGLPKSAIANVPTTFSHCVTHVDSQSPDAPYQGPSNSHLTHHQGFLEELLMKLAFKVKSFKRRFDQPNFSKQWRFRFRTFNQNNLQRRSWWSVGEKLSE